MKRALSACLGMGLLIVFLSAVLSAADAGAGALPRVPAVTASETPNDTPTNTPTITNTPDPCAPMWSVVSSPNLGTSHNHLEGVAAASADDVWAVGNYQNGSNGYDH